MFESAAGGCLDGNPPNAKPTPTPPSPSPPTPPPTDLGRVLSWIDCGSGADLPVSAPHIALTVSTASSGTVLLYIPPSNASGAVPSVAGRCPAGGQDALAKLLQQTEETWACRLDTHSPAQADTPAMGHARDRMAGFSNSDPRATRAVQVATQQLIMMTERQHDGLRVLKGPAHYYGSDPYDTFRITTAFQRLGLLGLSKQVIKPARIALSVACSSVVFTRCAARSCHFNSTHIGRGPHGRGWQDLGEPRGALIIVTFSAIAFKLHSTKKKNNTRKIKRC